MASFKGTARFSPSTWRVPTGSQNAYRWHQRCTPTGWRATAPTRTYTSAHVLLQRFIWRNLNSPELPENGLTVMFCSFTLQHWLSEGRCPLITLFVFIVGGCYHIGLIFKAAHGRSFINMWQMAVHHEPGPARGFCLLKSSWSQTCFIYHEITLIWGYILYIKPGATLTLY